LGIIHIRIGSRATLPIILRLPFVSDSSPIPSPEPQANRNLLLSPVLPLPPPSSDSNAQEPTDGSSYGQILKSSGIVGGAQALNLIIGLVRTKLVAVLLGPSGIGLVGLYISATGLVATLTSLGIGSSGVREIAKATGSGDEARVGLTVRVLRRICWITGLLGTLFTIVLAWPLSQWTFGSPHHAWAIALLAPTLLLGSVSAGQIALIQGVRRIGDLARLQVASAVAGTVASVALYAWLGERGIVPVIVVSSLVNLGASWWFARRVEVPITTGLTWRKTFHEARGLVSLGLAFVVSGLLTAGVALATRALILRWEGLEANGLYQAAWGISGVFAGFVLQAMGADFFPRLTAAADDPCQANRLLNEQTEIGVLLALPGLLATIVFAPWIVQLLYSTRFTEASELLPWFVLGVFGRVISWPLGYLQLAKGRAKWYATTETVFNLLHLLLIVLGLKFLGLKGVAIAFALLYAFYIVGMLWVAHRMTGFGWTSPTRKLLVVSVLAIAAVMVQTFALPGIPSLIAGGGVTLFFGVYSLRQLCQRLGPNHRLVRSIRAIPILRTTFGN